MKNDSSQSQQVKNGRPAELQPAEITAFQKCWIQNGYPPTPYFIKDGKLKI